MHCDGALKAGRAICAHSADPDIGSAGRLPDAHRGSEWHYHEEDDSGLAWFRKIIVKLAASAFGRSTERSEYS
jgi:hypothetical protein